MSRAYDIVKKEQDLTHLTWDEHSCPSGLSGLRLKAREGTGPQAVYYKRSRKGPLGQGSTDCVCELICSRLMTALGIDCVSTQLILAKVSPEAPAEWLIKSKSYRAAGEQAMPLNMLYELMSDSLETPFEFCCRMGWRKRISEVIVADYLSATRCRDASCFEVIRDQQGSFRLAPCMPQGFSLVNAFPKQTWRAFATADMSTSHYFGVETLNQSLELLSDSFAAPIMPADLKKTLLAGLSDVVADSQIIEASWRIIKQRWEALEKLCRI